MLIPGQTKLYINLNQALLPCPCEVNMNMSIAAT